MGWGKSRKAGLEASIGMPIEKFYVWNMLSDRIPVQYRQFDTFVKPSMALPAFDVAYAVALPQGE